MSDDAECDGFSQGDVQPIIPLVSFVGFMMLWAGLLSRELRVANVGGAIGLHYFEQDTGSNRSFTSLKWALTKSFGSLCFASLILAAAPSARALAPPQDHTHHLCRHQGLGQQTTAPT